MTGLEIVVGYLAAYAWRKARRVAGRVDEMVDEGLDAGLDRLGELVESRLGEDPGLRRLQEQAGSDLDAVAVPQRTMERVRLALLDEVETDPGFGGELQRLVQRLQELEQHSGTQLGAVTVVTASGQRAVAVGGDNRGIISSGDGATNTQSG
jgi:hypothetical protein